MKTQKQNSNEISESEFEKLVARNQQLEQMVALNQLQDDKQYRSIHLQWLQKIDESLQEVLRAIEKASSGQEESQQLEVPQPAQMKKISKNISLDDEEELEEEPEEEVEDDEEEELEQQPIKPLKKKYG